MWGWTLVEWRSRPEDLQRVFDEQNPWRRTGEVPASLAYERERPLGRLLWTQLLSDNPLRYQVVLGPRRVGKTTVLYQTARHLLRNGMDPRRVWWMRLDHPLLMEQPLDDLVRSVIDAAGASPDQPAFLMMDELVYTEQWDGWLKTFYDDRWPVRIAATSSATAALHKRRYESGVGRWLEQYLFPYSFLEFLELMGVPSDIEAEDTLSDTITLLRPGLQASRTLTGWRTAFLLVGGFPELLLHTDWEAGGEESRLLTSQRVLRSDAVERAVYKDIPQSFGVDNPMALERLLYVLAAQVTGLYSAAGISSDLGIAQPTIDRYLRFLEQAFLVFTLTNYSGNEATIQRRGRKVYFVDGAVRNAALQRGLAPLSDSAELGTLLENLVASSLHALAVKAGIRLHHWRDRQQEADLVWAHPERPMAFEIGSSTRHHTKGLRAFAEQHPRFRGRCYLVTPEAAVRHPSDDTDIGTLPVDIFLLAIGAQADKTLAQDMGRQHT